MAEISQWKVFFAFLQWMVLGALLGTVGAFLVDMTLSPWWEERAAEAISVGIGAGVVFLFLTWKGGERPLRDSVLECLIFAVLFTPTYWGLQYALEVMWP